MTRLPEDCRDRLQAVFALPEVTAVLSALQPDGFYLVGGAVRDLLLGRDVKDFDFLVDCEPQALLARKDALKAATGSTVIVLDDQRGILRVCQRDSEGLDLAARQGATVEADLARRDVTFNAMACDAEGNLLDPFAGSHDLEQRLVRVTSPQVLQADPLRVLRCLRLAAVLQFDLEEQTSLLLGHYASGLQRVAGERISEELQRFFAHAGLTLMQAFADAHLGQALWGLAQTDLAWPWVFQWLAQEPPGDQPRTGPQVLSFLAALLEPIERRRNGTGAEKLERLKLSRSQTRFVKSWWAAAALLSQASSYQTREIYAVITAAGDALEPLLSYAQLPAFAQPLTASLAQRIQHASQSEGELTWKPLPLAGEDLCQHWDRAPGRWVGQALAHLQIAWSCKEIETREALLAYSANFL